MRIARNLILGLSVSLAVACSDSTSPESTDSSLSFELVGTAQSRHEQLKQLLAAEREQIKRERENGKLALQIALAEWKAHRKELHRAKKAGSKLIDLLRCQPRPLQGDAQIIGPKGGTLHMGEHELVIPAGALAEEQLIVGKAPTSSLVDVEFEPEGLQFQRAARLTLSYKDCDIPVGLDLLLAYLGQDNRILELPVSQDYRASSEVTGDIHHFSRYAVAY